MTSPEPQNDVEKALLAAARDDARYPEFLRALKAADILIPQPETEGVASGERVIKEGEEISLPLVEHEDRTYVPVFTSIEQFHLGVPDGDMAFVRLPAAGLVEGWPEEHGMAVNPGGEIGVALDGATVRALARTPEPGAPPTERVGGGSKVLLGEPADEPKELLDAVAEACRARGTVRAAYRALMAHEGEEDKPRVVIGVEFDEGVDAEEFFGEVGSQVARAAGEGFSFIVVDESNLTSVARFMLLDTDPFFVRQN